MQENDMEKPVVIVGVGQMGGVFARGFLRTGHPVNPVLHDMSMQVISEEVKQPALVLVAVTKRDLGGVLEEMPPVWRGQIGLLQNELLPSDWQKYGIEDPTVAAVWFEKKFRRPVTPLIPTAIYGPQSELVKAALAALEIRAEILEDFDQLVEALVLKNLFILTMNIAGLEGADTVGGLLDDHLELTRDVFEDVLRLQEALSGRTFDSDKMWEQLVQISRADPGHGSRGRSAPERLGRALGQAESIGLQLAALRRIKQSDTK
jgi:hypothetical protein